MTFQLPNSLTFDPSASESPSSSRYPRFPFLSHHIITSKLPIMSNVEVTENGAAPTIHKPHHNAALPYQSVGDFLSNTNNFKIIESTLREGEQFANAYFDTGMSSLYLSQAEK